MEGGVWKTTDLGSAAFAMAKGGLSILGVIRGGEKERFVFKFSDPEGKGTQLQVDYMNSGERKYDEALRSLKKLCFDPADAGNAQHSRPARARRD